MKIRLLLLLVVVVVEEGVQCEELSCARDIVFHSQVSRQYNTDTKQYEKETKITFTIGLGENVCFSARPKRSLLRESRDSSSSDYFRIATASEDEQMYSLSLDTIKSIFTYKNGYTFALANPKIKCLCDCPGLEDHCSPRRDSCDEDGVKDNTCFQYYSNNQPSKGCGLLSIIGSGEVCCSVQIERVSDDLYKAFEISTPVTRATFSFHSSNKTKSLSMDLGSGSSIFEDDIRISFENPGHSNPIVPGLYIGKERSREVLTNVEVNKLTDWDVNKLGWYKYQNSRFQINQHSVKQAFTGEVVDCDESDIQLSFGSKFIGNTLENAKPIEEFYAATISKAERSDKDRNVIITYRRYSRVTVMISARGEYTITHRYSEPKFEDFYAEALLDKYSNRFLNITVVRGRGTLTGKMSVRGDDRAYFDLAIPSNYDGSRNYTAYIQITQWCDKDSVALLCLHDGDITREVCKTITCNEEPLTEFAIPNTNVTYEKIHKENIFSSRTWQKYINPLEWFNGIGSWQEGVIMVVTVFLLIILISILIRFLKFINCLSKCLKCCCKMGGCFQRHEESVEIHNRIRAAEGEEETTRMTHGGASKASTLRSRDLVCCEEDVVFRSRGTPTASLRSRDIRQRLSTLGEELMELWKKKMKYKKLVLRGRISESQYETVIDALDDIERTISPSSTLTHDVPTRKTDDIEDDQGFQDYLRRVERYKQFNVKSRISGSCPTIFNAWMTQTRSATPINRPPSTKSERWMRKNSSLNRGRFLNADPVDLPRSSPTSLPTSKGRPRRDSEPTSKSRYLARDMFTRNVFGTGSRLSRHLSSSLTSLSSGRSRDAVMRTPRPPQRTHKRDSSLPVPLPIFSRSRHNSSSKNQSPLTFPHPAAGQCCEPVKYLVTSPTRVCNTIGPSRQRTRRISSTTGVTSIECRSEVCTPELFDDFDSESDELNERRRTRHFSSPIID